MTYKDEIEDLKKALTTSPNNQYILQMLLKKMEQYPEYEEELEQYLRKAIQQNASDLTYKGKLINLYYRQGKYSTCLIIAEELGSLESFQANTQCHIAN